MFTRREWGEIAVFSAISILLYQSGVLIFLFCVPLQVLFCRRGEKAYLISAGFFLAVILGWGAIKTRGITSSDMRVMILVLDAALAGVFFLSLAVLNGLWISFKRRLYAFLGCAAGFALLSIPAIIFAGKSEVAARFLEDQIIQGMGIFLQIPAAGEGAGPAEIERFAGFIAALKQGFLRNFVFVYCLLLAVNYRLGIVFHSRSRGIRPESLENFSLPVWFVWPFLVSWAGVLLNTFVPLGVLSYIFWNCGLITLLLFGLQGIGILRFLLVKYKVPARIRIFGFLFVALILMIPQVSIVIYAGIPILGVSEIWIRYRVIERSTDS